MQTGTPRSAPSVEADTEQELWVEEVASRLGLPVGMLIRRIQAGVLPATAVELPDGVRYRLRPGPDAHADAGAATAPPSVPAPAVEERSQGIDSRTLVVGLLERWERTLEQRLRAEKRLADVDAEVGIHRLRAELEAERFRVAAAASEAGARERVIMAQASELAALRSTAGRVAEMERTIASLRTDIAERDRALADLHAQLIRRDGDIDRLRAELEVPARRRGLRRRD